MLNVSAKYSTHDSLTHFVNLRKLFQVEFGLTFENNENDVEKEIMKIHFLLLKICAKLNVTKLARVPDYDELQSNNNEIHKRKKNTFFKETTAKKMK